MNNNLLILFLFVPFLLYSQEETHPGFFVDANYFYGTIVRHNKDIAHLVTNHPQGFIIGYNKKTFGEKRWHREYNYPDWGFSFVHQNPGNDILGQNYGLYGHLNFYFLKRYIVLRVGQGIAYTTNKFDLETNFKNNAYGSDFLSSTYLLLNYNKQHVFKNIGVQAGLALVHYSNGNFRAPNSSTNSFTFNIGLQYDFETEKINNPAHTEDDPVTEPVKFNLALRSGVNESDYVGLGQHPFLVVSAFLDKRVSYKSTFQVGADMFFSEFLKKQIEYLVASQLDRSLTGDEDYKRIGIFVGHELTLNKLAIVSQFGYYAYYPYDFEGRTYIRAGLKYYFTDQIFGATTLKSHGAKVEGVEFGIGFRI
ncbi:acyloxyacyl hydrolase [Marixanthomonas spongiae]|uniref:Deacylase n=1 Tax=Marixanthomonas spongiae TaxID=2174845 RepID=A0A2U0I7N5_9FLAO|nr:acyloxyacyl hydrolase [Marixanthomonas spongiae]PVW17107.1 deacylase [Marixanthomonas spongiae]